MVSIRHKNLRLVIYSNDHGPPHVHVVGPGFEMKVSLVEGALLDPKQIQTLSPSEIRACLLAIRDHRNELIRLWRSVHGAS